MKNSWIHFVGLSWVFVFVVSIPAISAPTNGSFSDGLNGWTATGGAQVVAPGILTGDLAAAQLYDPQPGGDDSESTLSQIFAIDTNAESLSFWVKTPVPIDSETDHFFVSLYDSGNNPLFNVNNNPSWEMDYLFHWDSDMTWQAGESVPPEEGGPTVEETFPDTQSILYHFLIPVANIAGTNATLTFTLWNHLDYDELGLPLDPQTNTSILIDDIQLISNIPVAVVPAPAAVVLAVSGIMSVWAMRKRLF
jgi:hypothetical protein